MYFHKLRNSEKSLPLSILKQQESIQSNHFLNEIKENLQYYNFSYDIDRIQKMSKDRKKGIVHKNITETDIIEIKDVCQSRSKCKNLTKTEEA